MKHRIYGIVLGLPFPLSSLALSLDDCHPANEVHKQLTAEGQRVIASTRDDNVTVTSGPRDSGYVLQAKPDGSLCVVSVLDGVSTVSAQSASDVCKEPRQYPGAIAVCDRLKAQAPRVTRTVAAQSSRSALSAKMTGPVSVIFAICRDTAGREVLCGRTETAGTGASR